MENPAGIDDVGLPHRKDKSIDRGRETVTATTGPNRHSKGRHGAMDSPDMRKVVAPKVAAHVV